MSRNADALKRYWAGYRTASRDIEECGEGYALNRYRYGLQGWNDTQAKGYRARLAKIKRQ